jgi:hypothetical protein
VCTSSLHKVLANVWWARKRKNLYGDGYTVGYTVLHVLVANAVSLQYVQQFVWVHPVSVVCHLYVMKLRLQENLGTEGLDVAVEEFEKQHCRTIISTLLDHIHAPATVHVSTSVDLASRTITLCSRDIWSSSHAMADTWFYKCGCIYYLYFCFYLFIILLYDL